MLDVKQKTKSAFPEGALSVQPGMVLIDLDGTLVDSVPDLAKSIDLMMADLNMPPRGEAAVREWVGNGVIRLVERALTGDMDAKPDGSLFKQAHTIFLAHYQKNVCVHSRLYPGIQEGLDFLQCTGYPLGCVTNKPAAFTEPLLETLNIHSYFKIIISGDTLKKTKPDPEPLFHAAKFFDIAPQQSLMVGDSINDVQAARAAGYQIVCVNYGYNHGLDIRDSRPDAVIESLTQLQLLLKPLS